MIFVVVIIIINIIIIITYLIEVQFKITRWYLYDKLLWKIQ